MKKPLSFLLVSSMGRFRDIYKKCSWSYLERLEVLLREYQIFFIEKISLSSIIKFGRFGDKKISWLSLIRLRGFFRNRRSSMKGLFGIL